MPMSNAVDGYDLLVDGGYDLLVDGGYEFLANGGHDILANGGHDILANGGHDTTYKSTAVITHRQEKNQRNKTRSLRAMHAFRVLPAVMA